MIPQPREDDPEPRGEPLSLEPERREREGLSCDSSDSRSLAAGPLSSLLTTKGGAFMEPRGCNRWQSAAKRLSAGAAETSENRRRGLRPVAAEVPW